LRASLGEAALLQLERNGALVSRVRFSTHEKRLTQPALLERRFIVIYEVVGHL
jgi:hypothetical protein